MSHGLTNIVYAESTGEFRSALESATTQSKLCSQLFTNTKVRTK